MTFLQELAAAARACPNVLRAKLLRDAAQELSAKIDTLAAEATQANMQALNAAWVRAVKVWESTPPLGDNDPRAGAMPVEQMRKAA